VSATTGLAPSAPGPRAWRRAGIVAACLAALGLSLAAPAHGQEEATAAPERPAARIAVEALTGVLTPGGEVRLRVRVSNERQRTAEGLRLLVTLHQRETTRWGLQGAMDDGRVGNLWASFSAEIDSVPGRRSRTVRLSRSAAELDFVPSAAEYGVYPMRIQLQQFGDAVDELHTALVFVPEEVDVPVRAAFVLPVDARPWILGDGTYDTRQLRTDLSHGRRLQGLAVAAARTQGMPMTLATSGLLLEQVADAAAGLGGQDAEGGQPVEAQDLPAEQARRLLDRLGTALADDAVEHIALPYGPADLVGLVRSGMASESVRHITEGRRAAELHTGVPPTPGVLWPADGVDARTLTEAVSAGIDTVLLGTDYLDVSPERYSPSPVRLLRTAAGTTVRVLMPDPWLEEVLQRDPEEFGSALAAQRLLAETAAVYFERHNAPDRGILIVPPQLWDPPRGVARALIDGLAGAPWLEPVTLSGLARLVEPADERPRLAYPDQARSRELPPAYVAELQEARRTLGSLAGVLVGDEGTPARFDRLLRIAAAVHHRDPPRALEGRRMIDVVRSTVEGIYSAIEVVQGPAVTLAGTEGQVPVILANHSDVPLRLLVRLESQRYAFQGGAVRQVDMEPGQERTLVVQTQALTPGGTYPIRVVVEDMDGLAELAEGTVVVRSTGINVAALVATLGAALFLLGWWIRQARRRNGHAGLPGDAGAEQPVHVDRA
jgi:hypothetical protein